MPLPKERLDKIKADLDEAKAQMSSIEDIIADLRASGINANEQEAKLREVRDYYRKTESFYNLQMQRLED